MIEKIGFKRAVLDRAYVGDVHHFLEGETLGDGLHVPGRS